MSSDRDIRDRLGEALWLSVARARNLGWTDLSENARRGWRRSAADLLTALQSPTVKLKIEGAE